MPLEPLRKFSQMAAWLYLHLMYFRLRMQHPSRSLFAATGAAAGLPSSTGEQCLSAGGIGSEG